MFRLDPMGLGPSSEARPPTAPGNRKWLRGNDDAGEENYQTAQLWVQAASITNLCTCNVEDGTSGGTVVVASNLVFTLSTSISQQLNRAALYKIRVECNEGGEGIGFPTMLYGHGREGPIDDQIWMPYQLHIPCASSGKRCCTLVVQASASQIEPGAGPLNPIDGTMSPSGWGAEDMRIPICFNFDTGESETGTPALVPRGPGYRSIDMIRPFDRPYSAKPPAGNVRAEQVTPGDKRNLYGAWGPRCRNCGEP